MTWLLVETGRSFILYNSCMVSVCKQPWMLMVSNGTLINGNIFNWRGLQNVCCWTNYLIAEIFVKAMHTVVTVDLFTSALSGRWRNVEWNVVECLWLVSCKEYVQGSGCGQFLKQHSGLWTVRMADRDLKPGRTICKGRTSTTTVFISLINTIEGSDKCNNNPNMFSL
jgi:hypothetical protein